MIDTLLLIATSLLVAVSIPPVLLDVVALLLRAVALFVYFEILPPIANAIVWPLGGRVRVVHECAICGEELADTQEQRRRHFAWHDQQRGGVAPGNIKASEKSRTATQ